MNGSNDNELNRLTGADGEITSEAEKSERIDDAAETSADEGIHAADDASEDDTTDNGEEKPKPFSNAHEWASSFVYAVLVVLALNLFAFRSINVDGESMCNTLQDQDRIIATNFLYTPNYGDIVVVEADKLPNSVTGLYGEMIIKRVIALEGDTIRFNFELGEVYVNGELLEEDYIAQPTHLRLEGWCESGVDYVVPDNCVFVMGDNRNNSRDSRDLISVGFVDKDLIMGRALLRYFPFESAGIL